MFKLFEIVSGALTEVLKKNDIYTVLESGIYQLKYTSESQVPTEIFIEDEVIERRYMRAIDRFSISTAPAQYFRDYFGFAKVSIGEEIFQLNILIEKLKISEVEDIILYLFDNYHYVLEKFTSKSSYTSSFNVGKEYVYSSKYLTVLEDFCSMFELLFVSFKNIPHTHIRKRFQLSDINTQVVDFKSIEWILQNLDSVFFDGTLAKYPESIKIGNSYGLVDKIGAEQNEISYATYENEIILGALDFLSFNLAEVKLLIKQKLSESSKKEEEVLDPNYSDFQDLKRLPFVRLLANLVKLENRFRVLKFKYKQIFPRAKSKNSFPKLTPVFSKFKHYQKAFVAIQKLRNSAFNIEGEIQLLNVRKLSELYELYNLSVLVKETRDLFGNKEGFDEPEVTLDDNEKFISKIAFKSQVTNYRFSLFYTPIIKKVPHATKLITIGNLKLHKNGTYCTPDYILEVVKEGEYKYCILDSKYSKRNTVSTTFMTNSIQKYLFDVGIFNEPYKKADYLILLHPDSDDPEDNIIYNEFHFPKVGSVISKPSHTATLIRLLNKFAFDSEIE